MDIELWHGSPVRLQRFDDRPGGLHLGTREQAAHRGRYLHAVSVSLHKVKSARDEGSGWDAKIDHAIAQGYDGIVYLNRHEGIPIARLEALGATGDLDRLDQISDAAFRRLVPEARDSIIVLEPRYRARITAVIDQRNIPDHAPPVDEINDHTATAQDADAFCSP